MNIEDKEALKEFIFGVAFVIGVVGIFLVLILFLGRQNNQSTTQQGIKVVGEYKGCDIVQWNYTPLAEYKYFLYCEK
jgi:hypothetical protein